ncbi:hypothetical protein I547_0185 [Mycobacterium kansasii 824]|nr:hypothetical protein I547_0185 [Mycobacterium kansasii 824]
MAGQPNDFASQRTTGRANRQPVCGAPRRGYRTDDRMKRTLVI